MKKLIITLFLIIFSFSSAFALDLNVDNNRKEYRESLENKITNYKEVLKKKSMKKYITIIDAFIEKNKENVIVLDTLKDKTVDLQNKYSNKEDLLIFLKYLEMKIDLAILNLIESSEEIFDKISKTNEDVIKEIRKVDYKIEEGDFNAEYISNDFDCSKGDSIKVEINGENYTIPGIFDSKNTINENWKDNKTPVGGGAYDWGRCIKDPSGGFSNFLGFSPKGTYLTYFIAGFEGTWDFVIVESKTGKEIFRDGSVSFVEWGEGEDFLILGYTITPIIGFSENLGLYKLYLNGKIVTSTILLEGSMNSRYSDGKRLYVTYYNNNKDYTDGVLSKAVITLDNSTKVNIYINVD